MKGTSTESESSLRRFGLTVGFGLGVVAAISRYRGHAAAPLVLAGLAAVLLLLAVIMPRSLEGVKKAWLGLGSVLGWVNTRIILTCLYVLVVSPVGLMMRIFRDPLKRHNGEAQPTYWIMKANGPAKPQIPTPGPYPKEYERQF